MLRRTQPARKYYDRRNIIDVAEYVCHLANEFNLRATFPTVCRARNLRSIQTTTAADYIPKDQALAEMGELTWSILSSKTKSNIADRYLQYAAITMATKPEKDDARIACLLELITK